MATVAGADGPVRPRPPGERGEFVARVAVAGASNRANLGRSVAAASDPARFTLPLAGWDEVSDWFGTYRAEGSHAGIDLGLEDGAAEPVLAACDGEVTVAAYDNGYGYHVELDCGDGWSTLYAHLGELFARKGDGVRRGDVLGLTGSTGFSTGEHLHFEILFNGSPVDPELYLDFGPHSGEGGLPQPLEGPPESEGAEPLTSPDAPADPDPPPVDIQPTPEPTPPSAPASTTTTPAPTAASPAAGTQPPSTPTAITTPTAAPATPTPSAPTPAAPTATAVPVPAASPSPAP